MKATNAYAAKRAVFARLSDHTHGAGPLAGVQVAYDWPGNVTRECVYGGGVRFTQTEEGHDGRRAIRREVATLGWYVAVTGEGQGALETEQRIEEIADAIGELLSAEPHLGGRLTFEEIASGQGDYWPIDGATESRLGLQVTVTSLLT